MRTTWTTAAALCIAACVAHASAQVNDDAKAVLTDSAKAIHDASGVTFSVKTYATSILKDIIDVSGTVKLWRPEGAANPVWLCDGRMKDPGKPDHKIVVRFDGATVQWLDYATNELMIRPTGDPAALEAVHNCNELILPEWTSPTPFTQEMTNFPFLTKTGINNVSGEVCDVIEAMPADKGRNRTWCISVKDRLPRQLELGTGTGTQKITKVTDVTELKPAKFTAKDLEIALPLGFKTNEIKPQPAVAPTKPDNGATIAPPPPQLGLAPGTPAPAFTATDAAGKDASLASMKGSVVVLEFWGTMFKESTAHSADMKSFAASAGPRVKALGIACRSDAKTAADWWTKSGPGYALITKGDHIASDYKVAGFPSYCVIDSAGNISAFFQNFPGADKLKAATDAAK
jgi:peroxiredoxin